MNEAAIREANAMGSRRDNKRKQKKRARLAKARRRDERCLANVPLVAVPEGTAKMSEVLLEFVEPYTAIAETEEHLHRLLTLGLVAWNAALMVGAEQEAFLHSMFRSVPPDAREDMRAVVADLIDRKLAYYADIDRPIVSYDLSMGPDGPRVSVVSLLPGSPPTLPGGLRGIPGW
jgi:hypothetical protein